MKVPRAEYTRVRDSVLRLIPATAPRITLTNGREFARTVKTVLSKYVASRSLVAQVANLDLLKFSTPASVYGEFLIRARTLSANEPVGTFLFLFRQRDQATDLDSLLSPLAFMRVSGADPDTAPTTQRVAAAWYSEDDGLQDAVPGLTTMIAESSFHRYLVPVGVLVDNVASTFVNRVITGVRGATLTRTQPQVPVKLVLPADMYLDLDADVNPLSDEPKRLNSTIYACVTYVTVNDTPAMNLWFVRSGAGYEEVVTRLIDMFTPSLVHKLLAAHDRLDINSLTFGALVTVGSCFSQSVPTYKSFSSRGTSLPAVELSDFVAEPGSWKVFI